MTKEVIPPSERRWRKKYGPPLPDEVIRKMTHEYMRKHCLGFAEIEDYVREASAILKRGNVDLATAREVLRRIASDFIFIYDLGVDDKGRARMRSSFRRFLAFPMSAKVRAFIGDDVFFGFRQRLSEHQLWVEHGLDEPDEDE